jgi:hypothetical protein
MSEDTQRTRLREAGDRLAYAFLMPMVAAAAGAAARYAAQHGPELVEQKVLPRLRDARETSGGAVEKIPEKAKTAVSGAGGLAEGLTDRVRAAAGSGDVSSGRASISPMERERRWAERAERRDARRRRAR